MDIDAPKTGLTLKERRERRKLRREKQRAKNIGRAEKMHLARWQRNNPPIPAKELANSAYVGCSGWFYWKWRGKFYPAEMPTSEWFNHYAKQFDTVEINASFYSWPTIANVKTWLRQPGPREFVYTVKVCELITHIKRFEGTKTLVRDFGMIADILGERMGCFLFQLPPSYPLHRAGSERSRPARPADAMSWSFVTPVGGTRQSTPPSARRGTIFCSCSGPRLPDVLVRTADEIYLRLHGPERWYRHDYSEDELTEWVDEDQGQRRAKSLDLFQQRLRRLCPKECPNHAPTT